MPFTIERLPGEPILIARMTGMLELATLPDFYAETIKFMADIDGMICRILDFRECTSNFGDVFRAQKFVTQGLPGSATDPRILSIYVGTDAMIRMGVDMIKASTAGELQIQIFRDIDTALESARIQMAAIARRNQIPGADPV